MSLLKPLKSLKNFLLVDLIPLDFSAKANVPSLSICSNLRILHVVSDLLFGSRIRRDHRRQRPRFTPSQAPLPMSIEIRNNLIPTESAFRYTVAAVI